VKNRFQSLSFKCNLQRYSVGHCNSVFWCNKVGLYKSNPVVTHGPYEVKTWFQAFAFNWVNLYRYNTHEMDLLDEKEKEDRKTRAVALPGVATEEGGEEEDAGGGGGGRWDDMKRECTSRMKTNNCAMGTIPMWECEPCMTCVANHLEVAPWLTIQGPGVKPPPVMPLKEEPMFTQRHDFWDAVAKRAGTAKLLETIRNNLDR
jgi:hypothetical protein